MLSWNVFYLFVPQETPGRSSWSLQFSDVHRGPALCFCYVKCAATTANYFRSKVVVLIRLAAQEHREQRRYIYEVFVEK